MTIELSFVSEINITFTSLGCEIEATLARAVESALHVYALLNTILDK